MRNRIKQLRESMQMSLSDFGERIGMSISGLANLEKGRNPIRERHIKLILSAFPNVNETWLRDGSGAMYLDDTAPELQRYLDEMNLPGIAKRFVAVFDRMPLPAQREINTYLQKVIADLSQVSKEESEEEYIERKTAEYRENLKQEISAEKKGVNRTPDTKTS